MRRIALAASAFIAASSAIAQEPPFSESESALERQLQATDEGMLFFDAFLLCPTLLVRDPQVNREVLQSDGWDLALHYQDSADPFFSEYEGNKAYQDGRTAQFYVGREEYDAVTIGYCGFTVEGGATTDLPLDALTKLVPGARFRRIDPNESYGAWTLLLDQTFHARLEQSAETLYIQYTQIILD